MTELGDSLLTEMSQQQQAMPELSERLVNQTSG